MPNVYILKQFAMSLNILCSDVKRMLVKCRCSNRIYCWRSIFKQLLV